MRVLMLISFVLTACQQDTDADDARAAGDTSPVETDDANVSSDAALADVRLADGPLSDVPLSDVPLFDFAPPPDADQVPDLAIDAAPFGLDADDIEPDAVAVPPDAAELVPDVPVLPPDAGPPAYPLGPYGEALGDVIADVEFLGPGEAPWFLSQARGPEVRLIMVVTVAAWCPTCERKMGPTRAFSARLAQRGLVVVVAMLENADFDPASGAQAAAWGERYDLVGPSVSDPPPNLEPYLRPIRREKYLLVDAEAMTIERVSHAFNPAEAERAATDWLDAR